MRELEYELAGDAQEAFPLLASPSLAAVRLRRPGPDFSRLPVRPAASSGNHRASVRELEKDVQ